MDPHEWHPDGTGEGQCECDGRWFKTRAEHTAHVIEAKVGQPVALT